MSDITFQHGHSHLFSAAFRGRVYSKTTVKFIIPYFALRSDELISFGFGDFAFNSTTMMKGDSLGVNGVFFRTDFRFPTGSKSLYPFSIHSLDGGCGIEVRRNLSLVYLKGAATYTFVGERCYEGDYLYSNYLVFAASVGIEIGKRSLFQLSGYNMNFRKNDEHWMFIPEVKNYLTENIEFSICGGFEIGKRDNRIFNSMVSVYLAFRFPSGNSQIE
ncbi:hypothetical protein J7M07_05400 [bacterium]|nr:hypothetical protein [bacterium]